jgi:hypothetical protein
MKRKTIEYEAANLAVYEPSHEFWLEPSKCDKKAFLLVKVSLFLERRKCKGW